MESNEYEFRLPNSPFAAARGVFVEFRAVFLYILIYIFYFGSR